MDERPVYSVPVPIIDTKEENSICWINEESNLIGTHFIGICGVDVVLW